MTDVGLNKMVHTHFCPLVSHTWDVFPIFRVKTEVSSSSLDAALKVLAACYRVLEVPGQIKPLIGTAKLWGPF